VGNRTTSKVIQCNFFWYFNTVFLLSEGSHSINATNDAVLCLMTSWDLSTVFTMKFHMTWISKKTLKPDLVKTRLNKQENKLKKRRCLGIRIRKGNRCICVWRRNVRRNKLFRLQYISILNSLPKEKGYQLIVFQTKSCFKTNNSFLLRSTIHRVNFVQKHYLYTFKYNFVCYKFCNLSLQESTDCLSPHFVIF
jgi:hypothetical protein